MKNLDEIKKIITYYDEEKMQNMCTILYEDGTIEDLEEKKAIPFLLQYVNEVKKYTKEDLANGVLEQDPIFEIQVSSSSKEKILKEEVEKISESQQAGIKGKVKKFGRHIRYSRKMVAFIAAGTALAIGVGAILSGCSNEKKQEESTVSKEVERATEANEPKTSLKKIEQKSLFERVKAIASDTQKKFMTGMIDALTYFNKTFSEKHQQKDVLFPDGHKEALVHFGMSTEAAASAWILGADFNVNDYMKFMNASDISIAEYVDFYEEWYYQMQHAYAVRKGNEETGLLNFSISKEGNDYLKQVDTLHKKLRTARENRDHQGQQDALNELYKLKRSSLKFEEALKLEATQENFEKLKLPDYLLLSLPVFSEIGDEYRNWTVEGGKHFIDQDDEKLFGKDGIYCHIYEWTMDSNVKAQAKKLNNPTYKADESYADYDAVLDAVNNEAKEKNIAIDLKNHNQYKVEVLSEVDAMLNWKNYSEEKTSNSTKSGSSKKNSSKTETKRSTSSQTSTRTETTEEEVRREDLTEEEKEEAARQEQQIKDDLQKENEQAKEKAEEEASKKAKEDQENEQAKKEELEKEVEEENKEVEKQIEELQPGQDTDNDHIDIDTDATYEDPTTDGTGAYEDFPELNNDQNNEETILPGDDTSDQAGSIIEGEEDWVSAYESIAAQVVEEMAREGMNLSIETPKVYQK